MSAVRTRILPAMAVTAIFGGAIFSQTAGGMQQPRSRAKADPDKQLPVSETLQHLAGTGGARARTQPLKPEEDPKNTRLFSKDPTAHSKRTAQKTTDENVGGEGRGG